MCLRNHINLTETINALSIVSTSGQSDAVPGLCTDTGGYISNAEFDAIIATPGRIQQNYIDGASHSNVMVYNDNQWVTWMSSMVKAACRTLYRQLSMGGILDLGHRPPGIPRPPLPGGVMA
ncbi:hypothetical protein N0V88_001541 [Collariella sp. IMI 366227]|nr:hypothetical protein N0V88_001541 [Collariella sp. IMI 366227]